MARTRQFTLHAELTPPMNIVEEYRNQYRWRDWQTVFDALPDLAGQSIVDLGCGAGDLAADLSARGARVVGIDMNEELLEFARSRRIRDASFHFADLREALDLEISPDGLWCSFIAAYFPDLPAAIDLWTSSLKPGGWIALIEIDDLFAHEPLPVAARARLDAYAAEARTAGRYDFQMGRKLPTHLETAGFEVSRSFELRDAEFSFSGRADAGVVEGWARRFGRMRLLSEFCGADFDSVVDDFLNCLRSENHRSLASVNCCIATRPAS